MRLVIISGLIGSGKSTISKLLKRKGYHYLNADKIAKDIILGKEKVQNKLLKSLGSNDVFNNNLKIIKLKRKLNNSKNKYIKQYLMDLYLIDLDKSLRELGIGDMSIGKYVKLHVKKIYYRISKLENIVKKNSSFELRKYI